MQRLTHLTRVAAIGAVLAVVACETDKIDVLGPATPAGGDIFRSYVAIGNSITAGFQSGGINDSTQQQAYPRLLALQMGTQYHYASLAAPGCPPPVNNFLTQSRVAGGSSTTCAVRSASSITDVLNNVGVPDARVLDPTSSSTVASNALTTLILGGKTQVQRALEARPTFVSIWIGNNDVLQAAYTGLLTPTPGLSIGIVSTQAQFEASYNLMLKQLTDSLPAIKGVLIGVIKASSIPLMSTGAAISSNPAAQATINAVAGKAVTIDANCVGSTSLVSLPLLLNAIKAGTQPARISCLPGVDPTNPFLGNLFVHDPVENATLTAVVDGYNTFIKARADALGFAYLDPNPTLSALRGTTSLNAFPNYGSATNPFGSAFSLDGVHPSAEGQKLIANSLIPVINAKYGTKLAPVP